jgi:hypothetical protein
LLDSLLAGLVCFDFGVVIVRGLLTLGVDCFEIVLGVSFLIDAGFFAILSKP